MRRAVLAFALLCLPALSTAAPPDSLRTPSNPPPADTLRVPATVTPAVVKIGERIDVSFTFVPPAGTERLVGPPAPVSMGPVDVLVSESVPAGGDSLGWHLQAAFFQTGELDLSGIPFTLQTRTGELPVRLAPYTVSVVSSLPDSLDQTADIRDIRGPVETPLRWRWGRVAAAAALLLALVAAGVVWWRRRGLSPEGTPYVRPADPPDVEALRALRRLEQDSLVARGLLKDHYAELSLILRRYAERRFHIPAVESTTFEIRESLERKREPEEAHRVFFEMLDESDLVKFAKARPALESATGTIPRAERWVRDTARRTPAPAAPAPAAPEVEGEA